MSAKEEFIEIFREHVHRDGADALLDYLTNKSDFFTAPASARYHGAYAGGLCEHSLNVYHCLTDYLARERVHGPLWPGVQRRRSIALVALLHDLCKIGCYKPSTRNVKGERRQVAARCPPSPMRTPCPTATGRNRSIWSTALSA